MRGRVLPKLLTLQLQGMKCCVGILICTSCGRDQKKTYLAASHSYPFADTSHALQRTSTACTYRCGFMKLQFTVTASFFKGVCLQGLR